MSSRAREVDRRKGRAFRKKRIHECTRASGEFHCGLKWRLRISEPCVDMYSIFVGNSRMLVLVRMYQRKILREQPQANSPMTKSWTESQLQTRGTSRANFSESSWEDSTENQSASRRPRRELWDSAEFLQNWNWNLQHSVKCYVGCKNLWKVW